MNVSKYDFCQIINVIRKHSNVRFDYSNVCVKKRKTGFSLNQFKKVSVSVVIIMIALKKVIILELRFIFIRRCLIFFERTETLPAPHMMLL